MFGFGTYADDDTGSIMKTSFATNAQIADLNKTSVHNLGEERSVGRINNEIKIRGERNLEGALQKLVSINRLIFLLKLNHKLSFLPRTSA